MDRRDFLAAGSSFIAMNAAGVGQALAQAGGSRKIARDFGSLSESIRAASGAPATVSVEGVVEIPADLTVPGNCVLAFTPAGRLVVSREARVLIGGPITAGEQQIFDGAGAVLGSAANGSVRCAWFGVAGDDAKDNAQALLRLRDFLRHSTGPKIVTFPAGTYRYSRNDWVKGIRELEINAAGARFLNIKQGKGYNFEEHPFVGYWGAFNPTGYGPYVGGPRIFGYLMRSVRKGSSAVACMDKPAEGHFRAGSAVLVYGFGQQANSYPPSARYFEYGTVKSYDPAAATVTLTKPLRYDYDSRWHDFVQGKGAPRIVPLDRPDYAWGTQLVINGGEFPRNPDHKGNAVQIEGYSRVILNRVKISRLVPTVTEDFRANECEFDEIESDKLIDRLTYHACSIGTHYAATGVELLSFTGGTRITRSFETAARNTVFDDVEFRSVGARSNRVCLSLNSLYALKSVVFKSARVVVDQPGISGVMNGGSEVTFVVASVLNNRTVLVAAADDKESQQITQGVHQGFVYSVTRGGKKCTVANIYRHDSRHLAIEGEFSAAPQAGETYRGGNIDLLRVEKITQSGPSAPVELVFRPFANNIILPR